MCPSQTYLNPLDLPRHKTHHWAVQGSQEVFHIEADKESQVSTVKAKVAQLAQLAGVSLRVILFGKELLLLGWGKGARMKEIHYYSE